VSSGEEGKYCNTHTDHKGTYSFIDIKQTLDVVGSWRFSQDYRPRVPNRTGDHPYHRGLEDGPVQKVKSPYDYPSHRHQGTRTLSIGHLQVNKFKCSTKTTSPSATQVNHKPYPTKREPSTSLQEPRQTKRDYTSIASQASDTSARPTNQAQKRTESRTSINKSAA